MSTESNKQASREVFAAFGAGDIAKAFSFYADDVEWTIIGTTSYSGAYRGKQDLAERLLGKFAQDLEDGLRFTIDLTWRCNRRRRRTRSAAAERQSLDGRNHNVGGAPASRCCLS